MIKNNFPRIITQKFKIDYMERQFKRCNGYDLNLEAPKTFNEKIAWTKAFYRNRLLIKCSDKFAVREYVEKKIGKDYLIKLAGKGIYNSLSEIDFESLPDKFVLKATNGWEANILCNDKQNLDLDEARKALEEWLDKGHSHYYRNFEWAYRNIKPRIICEEFLDPTGGLADYKVWCFGGHAEVIQVCFNRGTGGHTNDHFTREWEKLEFARVAPNSDMKIQKPELLEQMISISEKLSKGFPFVRVDLYIIDEQIKFGELTFYSGNGTAPFNPREWDVKFGELFLLPKKSFIFPLEINQRKINALSIIRNAIKKKKNE